MSTTPTLRDAAKALANAVRGISPANLDEGVEDALDALDAALTQGAGEAVEPVATTPRETVGTLLVYACGSCGHPRSMVGGSHGGYWMQCESCLTKFNLNSTEYGVLMHRAERVTDAAAIRAKGTHD